MGLKQVNFKQISIGSIGLNKFVWARIENIPAEVTEVDLYLYRVYHKDFYYQGGMPSFDIMIAPQEVMTEKVDDQSLVVMDNIKLPEEDWRTMPPELMVKYFVKTLKIDRQKFGNGPLCMQLGLVSFGVSAHWTWEAVSIEFPNFASLPQLDWKQKIIPLNEPPLKGIGKTTEDKTKSNLPPYLREAPRD